MIWHDHISRNRIISFGKDIKPGIHEVIAINQLNQRDPLMAGERNEVDTWLCYELMKSHSEN
jgi:hypothetical protein